MEVISLNLTELFALMNSAFQNVSFAFDTVGFKSIDILSKFSFNFRYATSTFIRYFFLINGI